MTEGTGRVQQWGGPVEEIRKGDVVWIPPGQKHWHGAAPTTAMTHIAIAERLNGKGVDWLEKVSDEQYGKGPSVSQAATAPQGANGRAIASYEPGGDFPFPEGEVPPPMNLGGRVITPLAVPLPEFMQFTKIPMAIYYGDNIPDKPSVNPGQEQWRVFLETARKWRDAVNQRGGDVTLVHLPEIGIRGNTHFPMSDLNNLQIADHLSQFLAKKGRD